MYGEVYNILKNMNDFNKEDYEKLLVRYGQRTVDRAIDTLLAEDSINVVKFDYYVSHIMEDDDKKNNYYLNDLSSCLRLSSVENKQLSVMIYDIIQKIEEIFRLEEIDFSNQEEMLFLEDKVNFYVMNCKNNDNLIKVKNLYSDYVSLRDKLVQGNLRLVISVAKRCTNDKSMVGELVQSGNMGLMRAVQEYNPNFNAEFSTYAYYWIKNYILDNLRLMSNSIHISRHMIALNTTRIKTIGMLTQKLGREPTLEEVANCMNIPVSKLNMLEITFSRTFSINSEVYNSSNGEDSKIEFVDIIEDESLNLENSLFFSEMSALLNELLNKYLTEKERFVLKYRYGFIDSKTHTLEEVGEHLGVTRERVRQLEMRAMSKIRKLGENRGLSTYLK